MKKFLLLALTSLSLSCFGAPIRINLIARGGEQVPLIGNYYDEQGRTVQTPFNRINTDISIAYAKVVAPETIGYPEFFEFTDPVLIYDIDPVVLRQAIALITEPGYDIAQLDLPTIIQLIHVYDALGAPQANIEALLERCVELSIQNPTQCPFAAKKLEQDGIPESSYDDREVLRKYALIRAARALVTQQFNRNILPDSLWIYNVLQGHQDWVTSVAFSPDGQHIVTGSGDNTARIWNIHGVCEQVLQGHQRWVSSVAFSPDGQHIVTGSYDHTAHIWNIHGECEHALQDHQRWVSSVAFSPDGQHIVTGAGDRTARMWNIHGVCEHVLEGHQDCVTSVAFSPDGQHIVTGSYDDTARIWNIDGVCEHVLQGHQCIVTSVVFSPDGQHIATGSHDRTARIWNTHGVCEHVLQGHQHIVTSVAFSPDGRHIVTGSWDHTACIWNIDGVCEHVLQGHQRWVTSVTFSPDGQHIVTGSYDNTARIWHQDWAWQNWPVNDRFDESVNYCGNLLKQLLMLKVLHNAQLTPAEINDLRPIYDQLPASARAWIDRRTNGALRQDIPAPAVQEGESRAVDPDHDEDHANWLRRILLTGFGATFAWFLLSGLHK